MARADGDPASDVLLMQDSFLPYAPDVRPRLKTALEQVLRDARAAGFPMKVALIETGRDLGAFSEMMGQAQNYATLLTSHLVALNPHGDPLKSARVLVVMPVGFGGTNLGADVDRALSGIPIQANAKSDGLARAAIAAIPRILAANGHRIPTPSAAHMKLARSTASSKPHRTSPLAFALPALLLFAGLAARGFLARRRAED